MQSVTEHQYEAEFEEGRWVAGNPSLSGHHITKIENKTTRSIMEKVSDEQVNFEVWADGRLVYVGKERIVPNLVITREIGYYR